MEIFTDERCPPNTAYVINPSYLRSWGVPSVRARLRRQLRLGLTILVAFNLFDVVSTLLALHFGAHEANPLAEALIGVSPLLLVAAKVGILAAVWSAAKRAPLHKALPGVWLLAGVYSMVALNNSTVLWRLGRG